MTESKFKRLITAFTVGAVCLLFILLLVMAYQLISIGVSTNKQKALDKEIASYEALIEENKDSLEGYKSRWWIELRARELGYSYEQDVDLGGE